MTAIEYKEYKQAVKLFCDTENIVTLDAITDNGNDETKEPYFSAVYCECCRSHTPGDRLDCIAYNEKDHKVYNYTVCLDCYYYFEYGCLDDMTMEEIEKDDLKTYTITHRGTRERMNIKAKTFTDGCMDLGWKVCDCYYEIID